ncbi:MAG: histidine--tRNA ligase [Phycisphaeraceae bacterium]|nr:histidine--tRNA ligase [Phycisphaeraceae bacterium]
MTQGSSHSFQAPTGTRDLYPADLAKVRYIEQAWRQTSIRHGFDEIDGPTFEHLDLYTVKSGEGIVSELFSFQRAGGERTYALRPEFTPTLARMFAARAGALPRPTKWFCTPNFFRAERPQRGRLREFRQWNCDILGDDSPAADAELIACAIDALAALGLTPEHVKVRISHRKAVEQMLATRGVRPEMFQAWFTLLDKVGKINNDQFIDQARGLGMEPQRAVSILQMLVTATRFEEPATQVMLSEAMGGQGPDYFKKLWVELRAAGVADWCWLNLGIVRGLAYYTGMVFEIHEASGAERAIAGGGRYDQLIELFGGPPTPAVGFGMGDVVLSLVMQDKKVMPADAEIGAKLGNLPDAFVVSNGTPEADSEVSTVVGSLRRAGLHARRSYKATKNVGKLIQDAAKSGARFCVIVESDTQSSLKSLATGDQVPVPLADVARWIKLGELPHAG